MTGKKFAWLPGFFLLIGIVVSGCAPARIDPYARAPQKTPPIKEKIPPVESAPEKTYLAPKPAKPDPRAMASLELTEQGRMLLKQGHVDEAMTVFERAVNICPENGRNYYYLSEAWLAKGDLRQAREWNRLAELYLQGDPDWAKRVSEQKARIQAKP